MTGQGVPTFIETRTRCVGGQLVSQLIKLVKALMLSAILFLAPTVASADLIGDLLAGSSSGSAPTPAVPEPSGALVMGVALATVSLVVRRRRRQ